MPCVTYHQLQELALHEDDKKERYFGQREMAEMYGQCLCVVPTRVMRQGCDSYEPSKLDKRGHAVPPLAPVATSNGPADVTLNAGVSYSGLLHSGIG